MTASTAPKSRFKYAATLLGAFAILALAPATAQAQPVDGTTGGAGCTYTDKDGYPIPIDDGQSVIVDGKTVTCSGGTVTTTPAPKKNAGNTRVPVIKNAPVFSAQR